MGTERAEKHRITRVQIDQNLFPSCVHSIEGEAMVSIPDQRFTYLRHLASRTRQGDDFHRLKLVAHANRRGMEYRKQAAVRTRSRAHMNTIV